MKLAVEKRHEQLKHKGFITAAISLALALLAGSVIFLVFGANPLTAYRFMVSGALGSGYGLSEVVVKSIPLMMTGLAVTLAATMLLWNIGAEGQFVCGALGGTWAALYLTPGWPEPVVLPATIACGMAAGALWAMIPAVLKALWRVSEILTTLLLNYVAIIIMDHLYFGPWRDPEGFGFPGTATLPDAALMPRFFGTRIHLGLVLVIGFVVLLHVVLKRSKWGYTVRVIGQGPEAARYAGLNVKRQILIVMAMSGALAGLAGMAEVSAIHYRLQEGVSVGYGYDGIIVACLAGLRPARVPAFALILGALIVGAEQLQTAMQLPASIAQVLEGALLLGFLASEALSAYRIRVVRPATRPIGST